MRALWFYATAVTAVTMFCTFSLAVTAVTVVTCIYEFMGDSLCTYVHERASWYVRTQRLSVKLHMLDAALEATRINMTAVERKQFYDRHIKQMKLEIDENGDVSIELKR